MSTSENTTADAETGSERPIALKRRSNDVGWNYGKLCDVTSKEKVKCDFCGHISTGGINRFQLHIAGTTTCVLSCLRASPEAKAICQKALNDYEAKKVAKKKHKAEVRADVHVTALNESRELRESVCVGSTSSEPNKSTRAMGAMGAQEQLQLCRSARMRDLEEEFESEDDEIEVDDEEIEYEDDV